MVLSSLKNETMWKIGIILCVAIFILVRGNAPEHTLDRTEVLDTLDGAKENINEIMKDVYRRGLGYGEWARNNFENYAKTKRLELNMRMNEIYSEIGKLFKNLSDPIKEDCNEFTDGLYEGAMILEENMSDCILYTVADATEKLADAFSSASHGINSLELARETAELCDIVNDCDRCQRDIIEYRDEAVTRMKAAHKEYVDIIGNPKIFEKCINKDVDFGLKAFSDYLSNIVRDTLSCIANWDHLIVV